MHPKVEERARAITMRRRGKTYNEILAAIPVAKSTLSLWLRSVRLAKPQRQRITARKLAAQQRGALRKREIRIAAAAQIQQRARREVRRILNRERWLIGIALYWAEGSKEKTYRTGSRVQLSNTDPAMIRLFIGWLADYCGVDSGYRRRDIGVMGSGVIGNTSALGAEDSRFEAWLPNR